LKAQVAKLNCKELDEKLVDELNYWFKKLISFIFVRATVLFAHNASCWVSRTLGYEVEFT
jgi:hypothetical protein